MSLYVIKILNYVYSLMRFYKIKSPSVVLFYKIEFVNRSSVMKLNNSCCNIISEGEKEGQFIKSYVITRGDVGIFFSFIKITDDSVE